MDDRDMYYNSYGYGGFTPMTAMPNQMPMVPGSGMNMASQGFGGMTTGMPNNTYMNSQFNDINERVSRLERQVKRLDQRLTRLETPYANVTNYNNEPDNNMYMM